LNWQAVLAAILGTSFVAFFVGFYRSYLRDKKKLIDLEYQKDKSDIKEKVKNDPIDSVIDRIRSRFK
jgi:hypothetical protein